MSTPKSAAELAEKILRDAITAGSVEFTTARLIKGPVNSVKELILAGHASRDLEASEKEHQVYTADRMRLLRENEELKRQHQRLTDTHLDFDRLLAERDQARQELAQMKASFDEMSRLHTKLEHALAAARAELAELKAKK